MLQKTLINFQKKPQAFLSQLESELQSVLHQPEKRLKG